MVSDEELVEMLQRCEAATPGPWKSCIEGRNHSSGSSFIMTGEGAMRGEDIELLGATLEDYDFIASARQDVPRLIHEVQRLRLLRSVWRQTEPSNEENPSEHSSKNL